VYQHQDVISANHAAKAAGVKKHMTPAQARAVLTPIGGVLAHVHHGERLIISVSQLCAWFHGSLPKLS
jgi:hypothetical protein